MPLTRRTFNTSIAAVATSSMMSKNSCFGAMRVSQQQFPVTRRDVNDPQAAEDIESLRNAVEAMKRLKEADVRSWRAQARIYGELGGNRCGRGSWFFLPWNRAYLFYFENLIRFFSGNHNFALPYWDWSTGRGIPTSFYGANNPLNDSTRNRRASGDFGASDLGLVGALRIRQLINLSQFAGFGGDQSSAGALETEAHRRVHNWVSGNMATGGSPLDPIFWLHHCNVDRLYSAWLSRNGHRPPGASWQNQSFNDFFDESSKRVGRGLTCGQMLNTEQNLGYTFYSFSPARPIRLRPIDQANTDRWQQVAIVGAEETAIDGTLVCTTAVPHENFSSAMNSINKKSELFVSVKVSGYQSLSDHENVGIEVFWNPPQSNKTLDSGSSRHIGTICFSGKQDSDIRRGETGHATLFDVSEMCKQLYSKKEFAPRPIRIAFRAIDLNTNAILSENALRQFWPKDVEVLIGESTSQAKPNIGAPRVRKGEAFSVSGSINALNGIELLDGNGQLKLAQDIFTTRSVLILINGLDCAHCFAQLVAFSKQIPGKNLFCIAARESKKTQSAISSPHLFLDKKHSVFKKLGCYRGYPLHGTFVLDDNKNFVFQKIDKSPYMNVVLVNSILKGI